MRILKYNRQHEEALLSAISQDSDWDMFTNSQAITHYKRRLLESISYVCVEDGNFYGFVRALQDDNFAIYVSELFVAPEYRGRKIGKLLLQHIQKNSANLTVYILSDEDGYYEKMGYKAVGSIYQMTE